VKSNTAGVGSVERFVHTAEASSFIASSSRGPAVMLSLFRSTPPEFGYVYLSSWLTRST
jgi:hypothetical protein